MLVPASASLPGIPPRIGGASGATQLRIGIRSPGEKTTPYLREGFGGPGRNPTTQHGARRRSPEHISPRSSLWQPHAPSTFYQPGVGILASPREHPERFDRCFPLPRGVSCSCIAIRPRADRTRMRLRGGEPPRRKTRPYAPSHGMITARSFSSMDRCA